MAFMIKNRKGRNASGGSTGEGVVDQWIHVSRPATTAAALLASAQNIFQVIGGRVLIRTVVGQVTTIIQAQTTNIKVTSTAKAADGSTTVGTAVDVASNVDTNALEVGGLVYVEGDGTAAVKSNAGAAFIGPNGGTWVAPQGFISFTSSATSTGGFKWDLFYQPLDEGAYVVPVPLSATGT